MQQSAVYVLINGELALYPGGFSDVISVSRTYVPRFHTIRLHRLWLKIQQSQARARTAVNKGVSIL